MRRIIALVLLLGLASTGRAGEVEDLQEENTRLRDRIERLERENARLRRIGPDPARIDEAAVAERVTVTARGDGGAAVVTASLPLTVTAGSRADHALDLMAADGAVDATFRSWFTGGIHARVTEVVLDADDRAFRLPVVDYDVTRVTTGSPQRRRRRDHERLTVTLPRDVLEAAGTARSVGGAIGRVRFVLEPRDQATLRAFALRVSGSTP